MSDSYLDYKVEWKIQRINQVWMHNFRSPVVEHNRHSLLQPVDTDSTGNHRYGDKLFFQWTVTVQLGMNRMKKAAVFSISCLM